VKLNELIGDFTVFTTIEEQALLDVMPSEPKRITDFTDREQVILENLIKKSLVSKIAHKDYFLVIPNDR
tara:strand:+ start:551 stop:757 length:207 start_codon:yes stop_codon:yes gene_type:complete